MGKKKLYAHVLLDRSGSMESCRDSTIDAFNEYVNGLAKDKATSARVSLTLFDSMGVDLLYDSIKAKDFPKLTRETFEPRASTPLLDAIGTTVSHIDGVKLRKDENVALVVLTDGHENCSQEYKKDAVKALLEGRQNDKNWLVVYLGANQDAWAEGAAIGMMAANTMSYDTANVGQSMAAASRRTAVYAATASIDEGGFTEDERKRAKA